jgi:hypothetical protein
MRLYASTKTLRHSLVHRQLKVDAATGRMAGTRRPGEPVPRSITAAEQSAFCRAAQGIAGAAIAGVLPRRQRDQLRWVLDELVAHHEQPSLGGSPLHGVIPVVLVDAEPLSPDEVAVDLLQVLSRAKQATPNPSHFDLRLFYLTAGSWRAAWRTHPLTTASPSASTALPTGFGGVRPAISGRHAEPPPPGAMARPSGILAATPGSRGLMSGQALCQAQVAQVTGEHRGQYPGAAADRCRAGNVPRSSCVSFSVRQPLVA